MTTQDSYSAAGGVLMRDADRSILVLQRPGRSELRLPKGHVEAGETNAQAAVREVQEETGYADVVIAADLGSITHTFYNIARDVEVTRTESYFLMRLLSETRYDGPHFEHENFQRRWLRWIEAEQTLTYEVEREFVRRARDVLNKPVGGEKRA
jgi:8-oxo-dGTP pyrophosphatase MutT (NUDIX family)